VRDHLRRTGILFAGHAPNCLPVLDTQARAATETIAQ
jgi:hypothetical protein